MQTLNINKCINEYNKNYLNKKYSNYEIISLAYEKLLQNLNILEKMFLKKEIDINKKIYLVDNSLKIINELINSLDFNQGYITYYLNGIYKDLSRRLVLINGTNNIEEVKIVKNVIKTLYETWKETHNQ